MKRIHTTIFILAALSTDLFSQDIVGNWYAINRSGLIEFKFTNDSLETRALYSDLKTKGSESDKKRHHGIIRLKDKVLVIFPAKNKVNQYKAMTLFNIRDTESMEIAANGIQAVAGTVDELIKRSNEDTTTLYGIIIYNEHFIPTLKKKKDIKQMTLPDFKEFLKHFIKKKETFKDLKENMAGTLTYQLITRTLFDIGYNPLNGVDVVDRLFEKFIDDPEVKELLKKL